MKISQRLRLVILSILVVSCFLVDQSASAQDSNPEVVVLEASGAVSPALTSYISRGLETADDRNAELVILVLDTGGGRGNDMMKIVQSIRNSDVPVVVFVGPRGASAWSAGMFITIAGHQSAMAPDTSIGAASPVDGRGRDLESTMEAKIKEAISAEARAMVESRGEDAVNLVNEAIYDARAVSATEALEANLIDYIVEDVDELLVVLDGTEVEVLGHARTLHTEGASVNAIPMSIVEQILMLIVHPNIISLVFYLGILLIVIEISAPGGWVAGTLGIVFLCLGIYGFGIMPVNWLGIIFVLLSIGLFVMEAVTPASFGAIFAGGLISMVAGIIILFNNPEVAAFGELSIPLVILQAVVIGSLFSVVVVFAMKARNRKPITGKEGLQGQIGRVVSDLNPTGTVLVAGERWRSELVGGGVIETGNEVEILEVDGMRLKVKPVGGEDS